MPRRVPTVVLTTATGSLAGLADTLRAEGVMVREAPLLSFEPPADWAPVDRAIFRLPEFRAVAFTSPRAAEAFASRLSLHRVNPPRGQEAWATGSSTAALLGRLFDPVHTPSSLVTIDAGAGAMLATAMVAARVVAGPDAIRRAVAGADVLLVASPKVVTLVARVSPKDERPALVAIGPTTAAAARAAGWAPAGVARRPTVEAVADRIRGLVKSR